MGISGVKLVDFSKTRKYKILVWSLVGCGVLFFLVGIMFNITKPTQIKAVSWLGVTADNKVSFENDVYHLDLYQAQTPIRINTEPLSSNTPIYLSVLEGNNFITVTPQINNGGYAVIELKTNQNNLFAYGSSAKIQAVCGILAPITITVTIHLPKEHGEFNLFLTRNNENRVGHTLSLNDSGTYRLVVRFSVLGQVINNPSNLRATENTTPLSGIILFNNQTFFDPTGSIGIPENCAPGEYSFKIECTYLGQTFSTVYTLTVA